MSDKTPDFYLLLEIEKDSWGGNTIKVSGRVARPKEGGKYELVRDNDLFLANLSNYGQVWRSGDEWKWVALGEFEFDHPTNVNLALATAMYQTLTTLRKRAKALYGEMGWPANIGQSVQWAVKVVKASGIAIRQETSDDYGWQIWRNGEIAQAVNWRVETLKKEIQP